MCTLYAQHTAAESRRRGKRKNGEEKNGGVWSIACLKHPLINFH
jgi:hypothetical protein